DSAPGLDVRAPHVLERARGPRGSTASPLNASVDGLFAAGRYSLVPVPIPEPEAAMSRRIAALAFVTLFLPVPGFAQSQAANGAIEGVVRDSTGAVLSGTSVTVTNLDTGAQRILLTGNEGGYRALLLPLGSYTVKAEITGFKTVEHSGISLSAGQTAVINFSLEVGGVAEVVSVSGEAPVAEPGKIDLGRTISEREGKNL